MLLRAKIAEAVAVADPGSPDLSAALVKLAGDPEVTLRVAAAGAIGKLDPLPPAALSALVRLAKSDSLNDVRVSALRALALAGKRAAPARSELTSIAGGTNPWYALWAKVVLAAIDGDVTKAAPAVRAGLGDKSGVVRATAADALPLVGGPAAGDLPALMRLLREPSAAAKEPAARAVGRLGAGAKEAVPRLGELLTDRDAPVRVAAADALGRIGPAAASAAPKLRVLLTDPLAGPAARKALERVQAKDPPKT